ncbi:unnamed protein product [Symbiodinium sp. CCMP2592]|nr:unnamed protein product [Symbiodinium sp. CCMP2592]CAE7245867.1 unnamed protein product [Symbiodinium sp. CCMP2592]
MCEQTRWKAEQLHRSFPHVKHIFSDMKDLACGRAYDYITQASADVESATRLLICWCPAHLLAAALIVWTRPKVDGILAGYPCKSLSLQNNEAKSFTDKSSSTGAGFCALLKYVDRHLSTLQWIITENVAEMSNQRKKFKDEVPIKIQTDAFAKRGFLGWSWVLDAQSYGLPQSRRRTWAVYIRENLVRTARVSLMFAVVRCSPCSLDVACRCAQEPGWTIGGHGPTSLPGRVWMYE